MGTLSAPTLGDPKGMEWVSLRTALGTHRHVTDTDDSVTVNPPWYYS